MEGLVRICRRDPSVLDFRSLAMDCSHLVSDVRLLVRGGCQVLGLVSHLLVSWPSSEKRLSPSRGVEVVQDRSMGTGQAEVSEVRPRRSGSSWYLPSWAVLTVLALVQNSCCGVLHTLDVQ